MKPIGPIIKIEGAQKIVQALQARSLKAKKRLDVEVGYDKEKAPYAIYVHENLAVYHRVGMAKFLTIAVTLELPEVAKQIETDLKNKISLRRALWRAGRRIQNRSRQLVPVDTGNLRDSSYTKIMDLVPNMEPS